MTVSKDTLIIAAIGSISLGKYIFVTKFGLLVKLGIPVVKEDEKNTHGSNAPYENSGYGIPSLGVFAMYENTTVNTMTFATGCRINHVIPKADCLNRACTRLTLKL